jgi:hypothetical protein
MPNHPNTRRFGFRSSALAGLCVIRLSVPISAVLFSQVAPACSIPVFRYALDRWPADNYRLEVSAADAKDEAIAKFIRNFGAASALNLEVVRVPDGPSRLLRPHAGPAAATPVWSGALNAAALAQLTNSPARAELVRRILAGDSAVWVLVESGDRAADDAAARVLEKRLRYLEQVAQLPVIDPNDPASKLGPGPKLAVKFSVLRVRAPASGPAGSASSSQRAGPQTGTPPAESPFLAMLAGPQSGLAATREPWLAVVFGRGRVLGAWPAKGFGDEQIEEVCLFLLGACSCQVKNLNPGWDLLLRVDWDEELRAIGYQPVDAGPEASSRPHQGLMEPEIVTIAGGDTPPSGGGSNLSRAQATALGLATLLLLAAGGWAWRQFAR